ncbi:MAG: hypothetical protein A2V66_14835 [Ignavibacteria bacterium RBG_13_36_8]|nr:MAG: hypothetical protein A2V66_14835 [Ignavibacteria bacterium RBG_13_36_8]
MKNVYDAFIIGEKIYLRGPEKKDLEGNWWRWFNNQEATEFTSHGIFPNTYERQVQFIEEMMKSRNDIVMCMIDKETDEHIGVIGLHSIDWINRNAEISLMVDRFKQKRGVGLEAMTLMIDHGFRRLHLHKIYAGQDVGLEKWRKTLEIIGFKVEGFKKEHFFRDGAYRDVVMIAVFAKDFYETLKGKQIRYPE